MSALPSNFNAIDRSARQRRRIVAVAARASVTNIYEVPQGKRLEIESISICNTNGGTITLRLYHLGTGETASVSNALYYDFAARGFTTTIDDTRRYLNAGDKIAVSASTASVLGISIYGTEA